MKRLDIFGSFFLGLNEFALPVDHVQEVVNPPPHYASVPLGPPYLLGIFNLRGMIVPVVDLRVLLELPRTEAQNDADETKIAIVELEDFCIGLLFDRTGEIFKSREDERSDFEANENSVISGVFKKEEGHRIVQILDAPALFRLQNIPRQNQAQKRSVKKRGDRRQCISFLIGSARCGWGIDAIQEILKIDRVDDRALADGACLGHIDLRGATVPILDLAALLGYRQVDHGGDSISGDRRVVVMKIEQERFGLLVDAVENIVSYYPDDLLPFPVLNSQRAEMFQGCIARPEEPEILLLNHARVFSDTEIKEITRGHSRLYRGEDGKAAKKQAGPRRTYITFAVETAFAVAIEEIREIVECPSSLLQPPGLPAHFRGVLNLRGEMVTIVDARALYGKAVREETAPGKVLIFRRAEAHFGLVVDSVEAIVSFAENEKIKLPELLYQASQFSEDVLEAVEIQEAGGKRSLLILNAQSIAVRVGKAVAKAA